MTIFDRVDAVFDVVVNDEEQYSIWPAGRELPLGWRREGTSGEKKHCLEQIEKLWIDMRPRSLRESMARNAADQ